MASETTIGVIEPTAETDDILRALVDQACRAAGRCPLARDLLELGSDHTGGEVYLVRQPTTVGGHPAKAAPGWTYHGELRRHPWHADSDRYRPYLPVDFRVFRHDDGEVRVHYRLDLRETDATECVHEYEVGSWSSCWPVGLTLESFAKPGIPAIPDMDD